MIRLYVGLNLAIKPSFGSCMLLQVWHHLRSSEGLASSHLRCSVISDLHTGDCVIKTKDPSKDPSVKLLKFADDTTLIVLIQDGDESAYRQEVKELAVWCSLKHLELNSGDDRELQEK